MAQSKITEFENSFNFYNISFKRIVLYLILIFLVTLILLPLWTAVVTALKTEAEVKTTAPFELPPKITLDNLSITFDIMAKPLFNSLYFTIIATFLSCFIGSITGYIFSKQKFRIGFLSSDTVFLFIILGIFIPYQAIIVPLVQTMVQLHLYGSIFSLIITHTAYGIPICTLLFRTFYEEIPDSLIKAAIMDGAGTIRIYYKILLPLSVLPFVVTTVFQFTNIWNDFLFGLVLTPRSENQPASVALASLRGSQSFQWQLQMAGTIWYALPSLIVYFLLGKYLIKGFMAGAVKG